MKIYTTSEVANISKFSVRQLDYWSNEGIVVPSVQQSRGPGTRRLYSFDDLVSLRFVKRLKDRGWSTQKIRKAIVGLREVMNETEPLKKVVLIDGRNTILALCRTKQGEQILIDTLLSVGQQVFSVVLETLVEETRLAEAGHEESVQ